MKKYLKSFRRRSLLILVLILIFLSFSVPSSKAFKTAPDFTVETSAGEEFTLSEQDDPIIIEFMSPLCIECKEMEDRLQNLHPNYKEDLIFLSIDISDPSPEELLELKKERDIPWDLASGDAEMFSEYQGTSVPKLVIIDSEGYLTFEENGLVEQDKIKEEMEDVIEGTAERQGLKEYSIYGIAILGGITSFFSPCSFPLLPSYIAYYIRPEGGTNRERKKKERKGKEALEGIKMGLKTSLGIVIVFGIVGIFVISGGRWVNEYIPYLQLLVGGIIALLGILLLIDIEINPYIDFLKMKLKKALPSKTDNKREKEDGSTDPFYYGLGYGASSVGCTAPVFAAVLLASWLSNGVVGAFTILFLYLITMVILMVSLSILIVYMKKEITKELNKVIRPLNYISGAVLLIGGIYLIYTFHF